MRIAAAMDIQRVIASQPQRFGQRHFEDRSDFILAGMIVQVRWNNPYHRGDLKAGDAIHRRQNADDLNRLWRDRDLFLRLAQRGGDQRRIAVIYRAAGKSDLTRVLAHQRRTLG